MFVFYLKRVFLIGSTLPMNRIPRFFVCTFVRLSFVVNILLSSNKNILQMHRQSPPFNHISNAKKKKSTSHSNVITILFNFFIFVGATVVSWRVNNQEQLFVRWVNVILLFNVLSIVARCEWQVSSKLYNFSQLSVMCAHREMRWKYHSNTQAFFSGSAAVTVAVNWTWNDRRKIPMRRSAFGRCQTLIARCKVAKT